MSDFGTNTCRPRTSEVAAMIIFTTLLIAGASMGFAVQQWWCGYHIVAIAFIAFALVMAGVAMKAAKNSQNAEATEVQP